MTTRIDKQRLILRVFVVAILSLLTFPLSFAQPANGSSSSVPGELLLKFKPSLAQDQRTQALAGAGAEVIRHFDRLDIEHIRIPQGREAESTLRALQADGDVLFVQPNFIRHVGSNPPPNDLYWVNGWLWGMERIQVGGPWQQLALPGNDTVVVASIDTGVNYNHPDLAASMWHNPGEIPGNGIDDDNNGYIDDIYGIDAVNHDSDPIDDHGHGTHTSGTMAGTGNNSIGIAGVHWKAKIIACKFISAANFGEDAGAIECFNYLLALKARGVNLRVTNNSWGDPRDPNVAYPAALEAGFEALGAAGILNFCAAGNQSRNNDVIPFDPASFPVPSIVSVAASDENENGAWFSNYGATSVDFSAPGTLIASTYGSGYENAEGTSMSSPHAAGAAALIMELHPEFSALTIKSFLMNNVDIFPQWSGFSVTGGRLNLTRALDAAALAITTLQVTSVSRPNANTFQLTWVSVPGASYRVTRAGDLESPYVAIGNVITAGPGVTTGSYADLASPAMEAFYKVELVP